MKLDFWTLVFQEDLIMIIDIWELENIWLRNLIQKLENLVFIIEVLIVMLLLFY